MFQILQNTFHIKYSIHKYSFYFLDLISWFLVKKENHHKCRPYDLVFRGHFITVLPGLSRAHLLPPVWSASSKEGPSSCLSAISMVYLRRTLGWRNVAMSSKFELELEELFVGQRWANSKKKLLSIQALSAKFSWWTGEKESWCHAFTHQPGYWWLWRKQQKLEVFPGTHLGNI